MYMYSNSNSIVIVICILLDFLYFSTFAGDFRTHIINSYEKFEQRPNFASTFKLNGSH